MVEQQGFRSTVPPNDIVYAQPEGIESLNPIHAQLVTRERVFLYSLVYAFAPERALEIGVAEGGSSRIIHRALSALKRGRLVSLDPQPRLLYDWQEVADRAVLMVGRSPDDLPRARDEAGGDFDFVFVDGDHSEAAVLADLAAVAKATRPGALVLLHDAYYPGVQRAIIGALHRGLPYADAGVVCRTPNPGIESNRSTVYAGMHLLVRAEPSLMRDVRRWTQRFARRLLKRG